MKSSGINSWVNFTCSGHFGSKYIWFLVCDQGSILKQMSIKPTAASAQHIVEQNSFIRFLKRLVGPAQWRGGEVPALHFGGLGFTGLDPGCGPIHHSSSCASVGSYTKWRKIGTEVSSGPIFLTKKNVYFDFEILSFFFILYSRDDIKLSCIKVKLCGSENWSILCKFPWTPKPASRSVRGAR